MNTIPWKMIIRLALIAIACVVICMVSLPMYKVWQSAKRGEAALAEANYERQTLVAKARAEKEAAELYAEAEVSRAKGAAQSAKIIGQGLENNPNYLQYLAIQAQKSMADSPNHTTVYIPSGINGIPIIKAVP